MNQIRIILLLLASSLFAMADDPGPYDAGRFTLEPFAACRLTENSSNWRVGGGIAVGYQPVDNIEIQASALSYALTDSPAIDSIDEASIDFKGYMPLGKSGFAPFGMIGYTRDHEGDANLLDAGAGLAYRKGVFQGELFGKVQTDFHRRSARLLIGAAIGVGF